MLVWILNTFPSLQFNPTESFLLDAFPNVRVVRSIDVELDILVNVWSIASAFQFHGYVFYCVLIRVRDFVMQEVYFITPTSVETYRC